MRKYKLIIGEVGMCISTKVETEGSCVGGRCGGNARLFCDSELCIQCRSDLLGYLTFHTKYII